MVVGILKAEIGIDSAFSLKEKRKIIKSIIGRVKSRFNISIAEVEYNDLWKSSKIGFSMVSNDKRHLESSISKVIYFIEEDGRFELIDIEKEIMNF